MLAIHFVDGSVINWHVGEHKDFTSKHDVVSEVYADNNEQDLIYKSFDNIPTTKRNGVCWHGDLAKFIVANL